MLHAADSVQGLYAKYGFQALPPIHYGRMELCEHMGRSVDDEFLMRPVDMDTDIAGLLRIREGFLSRLNITGFLERTEAAWRQLIPLTGPVVVFVDKGKPGSIVAYAIVAKKNGVLRLFDFAVQEEISPHIARGFISAASGSAVHAEAHLEGKEDSSICVPMVVLRWIDPGIAFDPAAADFGWMLRPTASAGEDGIRACGALSSAACEGRFLLWTADSF